MEPKLPPSKGSRALIGYRRGLIILAIVMLALDCTTTGLLDSLMNPRYRGFHGMIMFNGDFTILIVPDVLTMVFFGLLAFCPQGFALLKKLSSCVLTACRVLFSLGLTALILFGPAVELEAVLRLKSEFGHDVPLDEVASAYDAYMDFLFCARAGGPDFDMTRKNQLYCQVARARWFLGFFLSVLVFGELLFSYWARDLKVQQERDRKLQPETGEYKTMADI
ncbi:hypothetical protein BGZ67_005367 [Mortierella alpina]|nr:hypothetical protein BGZ67_005367 [Mortierella alpina]